MKRFIWVIFWLQVSFGWSQGLHTQGTQIVNSNGEEVLLRGYGPRTLAKAE